jgi:drug/metabolite transporter (DMT)-like permease
MKEQKDNTSMGGGGKGMKRRFGMSRPLQAHLSLFCACAFWGLMAPLGKDAMTHGVDGFSMVTFRVVGACLLFWIASLVASKEQVPASDKLKFMGAAVFGLLCNQCCYTIGLSITAPTNASIMTTTMPIITMILAAIVLREPISSKKVLGIALGVTGALILILSSTSTGGSKAEGNILGDLLVVGAQCSFAIYLTFFKHIVQRYHVVTVMKWTFTYACLVILPFSFRHLSAIPFAEISTRTWLETGFVVFFGTFLAYILMIRAQKVLRPTVVSIYNYVQPTVACLVSAITGLGVFGWSQAIAIVLVFTGVYLVSISKSRQDLKREMKRSKKGVKGE